ncbi:uncharacterized protein TERG_12131 [Trichophyton rubrum CBS 118892]|uniref:Uncharacterized protein n=1 Tax=Trichophyton rubrum (strain ATCC MYA-4607 / CBS 118892) TaxID=559305 RepID=A0A080WL50_TRIRC|nr:uncharacterized protein TERG_12131 [Trichophyton rubrum CBS 118892]KFL61542.1 hypothetical protein TERG_12131 [Trichophyton rubrum CBS 118892]
MQAYHEAGVNGDIPRDYKGKSAKFQVQTNAQLLNNLLERTRSLPNIPNPLRSGSTALLLGAVETIISAPPIACNCSPISPLPPSIYMWAPSSFANFSLSEPLDKATTRYPNLFAY